MYTLQCVYNYTCIAMYNYTCIAVYNYTCIAMLYMYSYTYIAIPMALATIYTVHLVAILIWWFGDFGYNHKV